MFYQPELETLLDRRVGDFPCIERKLGWTVSEIRQEADGVAVCARSSAEDDDTILEVFGRYVVGCDGANSFLRPYVDTTQVDLDFYFDWLIVSGELKTGELDSWGFQLCDPYRPQTFVPAGPHRARFEFMLRPDETTEEMQNPEVAWRLMAPWGFDPDNFLLERHAVYTFSGKWSQNWRKGRLIIAGDAAHQTPPFLGQGMCSGIRDVYSLAWRLNLILEGKASEKLLDDYTTERVKHTGEIVTEAVEIGKVLCVTDPKAAEERDAAMLAQANDVPLVLSWRMGPGAFRKDDPSAACLSIQAVVRHGGKQALLDDFTGSGFRLLTLLPADEVRTFADLGFFENIGGHVLSFADDYEDITGAYHGWIEGFEAAAILVRPDFYNFGMVKSARELPALFMDLEKALA